MHEISQENSLTSRGRAGLWAATVQLWSVDPVECCQVAPHEGLAVTLMLDVMGVCGEPWPGTLQPKQITESFLKSMPNVPIPSKAFCLYSTPAMASTYFSYMTKMIITNTKHCLAKPHLQRGPILLIFCLLVTV